MEFICSTSALRNAVAQAEKAAATKSPTLELVGMLITAVGGRAVLYCTDREFGVECAIDANVYAEGEAIINAHLFADCVRNMSGDTTRFSTLDGSRARLTSEEAVIDLNIIQTEAFPPFPDVSRDTEYRVDRFALKRMMQQTGFAIGTDDTRKPLTGLFIEGDEHELRTVAVDGFRIALRRQKSAVSASDERANGRARSISMIIPAKSVSELIKIIPSDSGEMSVHGNRNQAVFSFDGCRVFTRVIDGEFFNYKYILPDTYVTQFVVQKAVFQDAIVRAMVVLLEEESYKRYPVLFSVVGNMLDIKAMSNLGHVADRIQVDVDGEEIKAAFNPRFLYEALRAIEDETIVVRFTTRVGQILFLPVENDGYAYLTLPVRFEQ